MKHELSQNVRCCWRVGKTFNTEDTETSEAGSVVFTSHQLLLLPHTAFDQAACRDGLGDLVAEISHLGEEAIDPGLWCNTPSMGKPA